MGTRLSFTLVSDEEITGFKHRILEEKYKSFSDSALLPALLIYTFILLIPIVDSMRLSFYTGSGLIPNTFIGLGNYIKILLRTSFGNGSGRHSPTTSNSF